MQCSRIQMDTVRPKNRSKFLQPLHPLLPLPPSRRRCLGCCLGCEAGWRPIMSLCLFRQSCLKWWCVTRAELYCLRPASVCRIKASHQCLHLPQEDKGSSERHPNTALPQFFSTFFLFFETSKLTAKNAPVLKLIYLSSPWLSYCTTFPVAFIRAVGTRRASLFEIRHLLICSVLPCIVAKFLIQAPQNTVPVVGNLFLVSVPEAVVANTCIRQERQKLQPDSLNREVQANADPEKC